MKNSKHLLIVMCLLAISFVACKKDQVCTCDVSSNYYKETLIYNFTERDKNAKDVCNTYEKNAVNNYVNSGLTDFTVDCNLK